MSSSFSGREMTTTTSRRSRHRENVTLILVVVVSVFIVCQLPDLGLRIAAAVGL